jgi:hypothetical protein
VNEPRELQIRPVGPGWEWSGAFAIPEREEYVGLRIRNSATMGGVILPVNTTVGRSGVVLVTLKSQRSIPPIR